jgi:hypothetical protein
MNCPTLEEINNADLAQLKDWYVNLNASNEIIDAIDDRLTGLLSNKEVNDLAQLWAVKRIMAGQIDQLMLRL